MKLYTDENNQRRAEQIFSQFENSLISIGINPEGKDLLGIIVELADEINKVKADLYNFQEETR